MSEVATGNAGTRAGRWPLWIGLLTLALHGFVAWLYPLNALFRKYSLAAEQYLAGELAAERLTDFSAFYFHLSVALERLLPAPEAALTWSQLTLTAAATVLVFLLVRRRLGPRWGAAAALVMAFDRHLLIYTRILEPEVFLLFFLLAFLWLLDREPTSASPGWHVLGATLAGGSAALCLAIRPTFLPAFLLVPLYFRLRGERGRRWLAKSLAFLAPVAGMLALLALRADAITGDPWTPAMNPGTVFFEGNNPLSQGTSAIYPPVVLAYVRHTGGEPDAAHRHYRDAARAATERELSIAEVNTYWSSLATRYIRDHPGHWLGLLAVKLKRAFHSYRWHDVPPAWQLDIRLFLVPSLPFALLSALAFVGALFEVRHWRRSLLYYALAATQLSVMLVFYVSARQRLILLPALCYFAAIGVRRLVRDRAWHWLLLVALMAVTFSLPDDAMRDEIYRRGRWLEIDQKLDQVREKSRSQPLAHHADLAVEAVATAPWWLDWLRPAYFPLDEGTLEERVARLLASRPPAGASAEFDLAAIYLETGQLAEARVLLETLVEEERVVYRGGQQPSEPLVLLGRAVALSGDTGRAVEILKRAREGSPGDPFILAELVVLGDAEARAPLERFWSPLDAQYLVGRAALRYGRHEEAVKSLASVVRRQPDFRDARMLLAAALGAGGRIEEGAHHYLEATRLRPEPILASEQISELFRRWAASRPQSYEVQLYAAQVLHRHGHFREALAILERLESLEPQGDPARAARAAARESDRIRRALGE